MIRRGNFQLFTKIFIIFVSFYALIHSQQPQPAHRETVSAGGGIPLKIKTGNTNVPKLPPDQKYFQELY